MVERESFATFLKLALVTTDNVKRAKELVEIYTDEHVSRVKRLQVSMQPMKKLIARIFSVAPDAPHHLVREMLSVMLGVSFDARVLHLIKAQDPFLATLRNQLVGNELKQEDKTALCWAVLESEWSALQSFSEHSKEPKQKQAKIAREEKEEDEEEEEADVPMLILEECEVLSDGCLSDEGEEEDDENEAEEKDDEKEGDEEEDEAGEEESASKSEKESGSESAKESGSASDKESSSKESRSPSDEGVRVVRRADLNQKRVRAPEDEVEVPFGELLQSLEEVGNVQVLKAIEAQVQERKLLTESGIHCEHVDVSRYYYVTPGADGEVFDVVNLVNGDVIPNDFKWLNKRIYSPSFPEKLKGTEVSFHCECEGNCLSNPLCVCRQENQSQSAPYDSSGHLLFTNNWLIRECNKGCKCYGSDSCGMRVSQQPSMVALQLFQTDNRGWGVRCDKPISKGAYVAEYFGELLDQAEATLRGQKYDNNKQSYLFDLDWEFNNFADNEDLHAEFQPSREDILTSKNLFSFRSFDSNSLFFKLTRFDAAESVDSSTTLAIPIYASCPWPMTRKISSWCTCVFLLHAISCPMRSCASTTRTRAPSRTRPAYDASAEHATARDACFEMKQCWRGGDEERLQVELELDDVEKAFRDMTFIGGLKVAFCVFRCGGSDLWSCAAEQAAGVHGLRGGAAAPGNIGGEAADESQQRLCLDRASGDDERVPGRQRRCAQRV